MSDVGSPEIDSETKQETDSESKSPFYPGISSNRLYFHGTRSRDGLDGILNNGLEPPTTEVSKDTLARRISFTDFERYSGSGGFILGIKPQEGEIDEISPQFAREVRINSDLGRLSPERNIFYLSGSTKLTRGVFNQIRQGANDYFEAGFNDELFLSKLNQIVGDMEEGLKKEATMINGNDPENIHLVAQEIVWNELCGYTTHGYDDLEYNARVITDIRKKQTITSSDQLLSAIKQESEFINFDLTNYLNNLRFLNNIGNIKGLGFEGLNYSMTGQIEEVAKWLNTLSANDDKNRQVVEDTKKKGISRLIAQLRHIEKR